MSTLHTAPDDGRTTRGFVSFVSPSDGTSLREENGYAYWLERLKSRKQDHQAVALSGELQNENAHSSTDKTDKTSEGSTPDPEVLWRVAAFRARIPSRGPIWPPRIRNTPLTDTAGHCSLCGDALPTGDQAPRFRRCAACVRALWRALNVVREAVPHETA
jgi:hypothetical protein